MDEPTNQQLTKVVSCLQQGGIIAYPTEAVYGLGCDPLNGSAVMRILQLKQRVIDKGLIIIAANWQQLQTWVEPMNPPTLARICATWPGPNTWVFPASNKVPLWIRGDHTTVAIRVTAHPVARALCDRFAGPIVSTSANVAGHPPIRDVTELITQFSDQIDMIVPGKLGNGKRPSTIRDASTGRVLR